MYTIAIYGRREKSEERARTNVRLDNRVALEDGRQIAMFYTLLG